MISSHDSADFVSKMAKLIQEHFVTRKEYEKLKDDFDLLEQEHLRSKQIFQKKLEEWELLKKSLQSQNSLSTKIAHKPDNAEAEDEKENLHIPKAPRMGNKASKRIIFGGDTPPGYWSTRFTPET